MVSDYQLEVRIGLERVKNTSNLSGEDVSWVVKRESVVPQIFPSNYPLLSAEDKQKFFPSAKFSNFGFFQTTARTPPAANPDLTTYHDSEASVTRLAEDQEIEGIRFPKETILKFENGDLSEVKLLEDAFVQGIPYVEGKPASFRRKVAEAIFAKKYRAKNFVIDAGSEISFWGSFDGSKLIVVNFGKEVRVNSWPCLEVYFRKDGSIGRITLTRDAIIQGYLFKGRTCEDLKSCHTISPTGNRGHVDFYDNGKIKDAFLQRPHVIQGIHFKAGTAVFFTRNGKVIHAEISENKVIRGIPCGIGDVDFHSNGRVKQCTVSRAIKIGDASFSEGDLITLNPDGTKGEPLFDSVIDPTRPNLDYFEDDSYSDFK